MLSCRGLVSEPFAVINADDYYGKEAFVQLCRFLKEDGMENPTHYAMVGFILRNTLSDHGAVTRGICSVDENGYLTDVLEAFGIQKTGSGVEANGVQLDPEGVVSMNMWGLMPAFIGLLQEGFVSFL